LRAAGVSVWEQTPVMSLARSGSGWILATPVTRVSAARVILANNGHIESFGFARNCLMHVFLYASMTADLGPEALCALGGRPRWGVTPSDPMGTTIRRIDGPLGGNRIITRTCATFEPGMEPSDAALRRTAAIHRQKLADRFPALAGTPMDYTWAGHLRLTRNGVSRARELEDGLYAAAVCNGLGTARSTLTGIAAAELALGRTSDVTRHFAANAEPVRLPPRPLAAIGANLLLRWKEWRAGAE